MMLDREDMLHEILVVMRKIPKKHAQGPGNFLLVSQILEEENEDSTRS
jgi:hypothetical protein